MADVAGKDMTFWWGVASGVVASGIVYLGSKVVMWLWRSWVGPWLLSKVGDDLPDLNGTWIANAIIDHEDKHAEMPETWTIKQRGTRVTASILISRTGSVDAGRKFNFSGDYKNKTLIGTYQPTDREADRGCYALRYLRPGWFEGHELWYEDEKERIFSCRYTLTKKAAG